MSLFTGKFCVLLAATVFLVKLLSSLMPVASREVVMPHPLTEKLIQRQINHWNNLRQYLTDPPDVSPPEPRP
jgi:hypothetical protein